MTQASLDSFLFSGKNYPFIAAVGRVTSVIEDLHIVSMRTPVHALWLDRYNTQYGSPVSIDFAVNREFELKIVDDSGAVFADTRELSIRIDGWSAERRVFNWVGDDILIIATVSTFDSGDSGEVVTNGVLDPRVIDWRPTPITDVQVWSDGEYQSVLGADKTPRFRNGYNTGMPVTTEISSRGEKTNTVALTFQSGFGLGRHPACDLDVGVKSLGGAIPDSNGNLLISGDSCLYIRPKVLFGSNTAAIVPGEFLFSDGCDAECTCDDFSNLYKYAKRIWARYTTIASRADEIRDIYHVIRDYMEDVKKCAEQQPLRIMLWPVRNCAFAAAVGICNPSDVPLADVVLEFNVLNVDNQDIGSAVNCDTIHRVDYYDGQQMPVPYYFDAPLPNARVTLRCVPPGHMSYVVFRATVPDAEHGREVKVCGSFPTGVPLPLPTPLPGCGTTKLECPEPENCG